MGVSLAVPELTVTGQKGQAGESYRVLYKIMATFSVLHHTTTKHSHPDSVILRTHTLCCSCFV